MQVTFMKSTEKMLHGVLKLYDRRYPGRIRQTYGTAAATTPSVAADAAYRSLVRQGTMDVFLLALQHIYDTEPNTCPSDFLHNEKFGGDRFGGDEASSMARFEAATWYQCDQHFKTELKAYKQLERLQGTGIPRLYAHVRIPYNAVPQTAREDEPWDRFFCVHGLLLEDIPGTKLEDWPTLDITPYMLSTVAKGAAEMIHQINAPGVLLQKTCKNVIVKKHNNVLLPFIVDFTVAVFKEDLDKFEIRRLATSHRMLTEFQTLQPALEREY